jgi:hypothetical protein
MKAGEVSAGPVRRGVAADARAHALAEVAGENADPLRRPRAGQGFTD